MISRLCLLLAGFFALSAHSASPPNVVVFLADD